MTIVLPGIPLSPSARLSIKVIKRFKVSLAKIPTIREALTRWNWTLEDAFTSQDGISVLWANAGVTEIYSKHGLLIALDITQ